MNENRIRHRITLVHGTFARGAGWTQDGSRLADALRSKLGSPVEIERCEWSGGNSAAARAQGAALLADRLRAQGDKAPNERRFIVAHSHGGNVAMYALRDPEVAGLVDGVVTMATPFLVAHRRDLGPKGVENMLVVLLVGIVTAYRLLVAPQLPASVGENGRLAGMFLFTWIATITLYLLYTKWSPLVDELLATLRLAELPAHKLLVVRATGDEASALLLSLQFVSQIFVRLLHLMQHLHITLDQRFRAWSVHQWTLLATAVGGFLLLVGLTLLAVESGWPNTNALAIALVVAMLVIVITPGLLLLGWIEPATVFLRFIASLALVPAALALAVCMLPLDWRVALANLMVDVTVEAAPPGAWTIHQFVPEPTQSEQGQAPGLAHSVVYDDERVIRVIVDWMRHAALASR